MKDIELSEEIIAEKANFIVKYADSLCTIRRRTLGNGKKTDENLLDILLSDKPLKKCSGYEDIMMALFRLNYNVVIHEENTNYAYRLILSVCNLINVNVPSEKTRPILMERIYKYYDYMRTNIFGQDKSRVRVKTMKEG